MRTEQLQYFVEVAKFGSFSLAAQNLHIAQPSISQAISNLEQNLNVKLFERSRTGIRLTPIGHSLYIKAQNILNIVDEMYDEVRAETNVISGNLQIASIPSICNAYLSDVLSAYKKKYPNVRIEVNEEGTSQILQEVLSNRVDIGLVSRLPNDVLDKKIEFFHLITGTYMAYVGKNSSLPLRNPISSEVIAKQPLITLKGGSRQEEYLKKMLHTDELNVLLTLGYTEAAKKIIAEGVAIGFYPDFSVKRDPFVKSGDIIPLEIENNSLVLQFGWVRAKNQRFSTAAQEFIKLLKGVISNR